MHKALQKTAKGSFKFHSAPQGHHLGGHWPRSVLATRKTTRTLRYSVAFVCVDFLVGIDLEGQCSF